MVGPDAPPALPWLEPVLRSALAGSRGHHALLVHGAEGVGQFDLALMLAQAWLCESTNDGQARPCGQCASCRLVQSHTHPDLLVLLPEVLQANLGWAREDDGAPAAAKSDRKPSKELKVDQVRQAVAFAQLTTSRGRAKVVVLFPAERMNGVSANTLLKTLEEPPGQARFVLATGAPQSLLPTVRSRCQSLHLPTPPAEVAQRWLAAQGVAEPGVLLAAAGGQPLLAKAWSDDGISAADWRKLPRDVAAGRTGALPSWPAPRAIDALQKVCHDALLDGIGAVPRYFPEVPKGAQAGALHAWARALARAARHAEHPLNVGLLVESLVDQGRRAWARDGASPRASSVNSAA